jgi:hexulose-6-phosphate isomerase
MIKGINQWSLPSHPDGILPVLQHAVQSGISHFELCIEPIGKDELDAGVPDPELEGLFSMIAQGVNAKSYFLKPSCSEGDLLSVKDTLRTARATVTGVTTLDLFRYTLTSGDKKKRRAAVEIVRRMVDICSSLGGSIVLIEPGVVTSSLSYRDAYANCQAAMKEAAGYAEKKNVTLALENVWGKFLMSPLEFAAFLDGFRSEAVGAYFDVANVLAFGYPQDWIRILAHRIKSIHFKDFNAAAGGIHGFCNPFDGSVDWFAVKRALEAIEYDGYIVAEVIIPETWQRGFIPELSRKMDYFINDL